MASSEEVFVTSRSRTPSLINVTSQKDHIFGQLPDLIQEALVSAEFSSPQIEITRVHHSQAVNHAALTEPVFFIRSRVDSGISMVDFHVTDEEILAKFGTDLTANFADIRVHGPKAFFQKENTSNGVTYSLSACATGYIWIYVTPKLTVPDYSGFLDMEVQIGTFASRTRAVTTSEISCRYLPVGSDLLDGHLALLCSTVLGIYLRLCMMGHQYEYATETAIKQGRKDLSGLRVVEPGWFGINGELFNLLRGICANAPMPPISDVSLISRSMITRRWDRLRETRTLRKTHSFPLRALRSLKGSNVDALHLLTKSFKALEYKPKSLSPPAVDYQRNGASLQSFYTTIPCQPRQISSPTGPSGSDLSRS